MARLVANAAVVIAGLMVPAQLALAALVAQVVVEQVVLVGLLELLIQAQGEAGITTVPMARLAVQVS